MSKNPTLISLYSPTDATGKTLVGLSLAATLAGKGKKTVMVDLHLTQPDLSNLIGAKPSKYWLDLTDFAFIKNREFSDIYANPSTPDLLDDENWILARQYASTILDEGIITITRLHGLDDTVRQNLNFICANPHHSNTDFAANAFVFNAYSGFFIDNLYWLLNSLSSEYDFIILDNSGKMVHAPASCLVLTTYINCISKKSYHVDSNFKTIQLFVGQPDIRGLNNLIIPKIAFSIEGQDLVYITGEGEFVTEFTPKDKLQQYIIWNKVPTFSPVYQSPEMCAQLSNYLTEFRNTGLLSYLRSEGLDFDTNAMQELTQLSKGYTVDGVIFLPEIRPTFGYSGERRYTLPICPHTLSESFFTANIESLADKII